MKTKVNLLAVGLLFLTAAQASFAAYHYVNVNNVSPAPPYTDWASAATNIQDAVDAALAGDTVLVTNGVYASGGRAVSGLMTNRVAVDKPLTVLSLKGPSVTVIAGASAPGGPPGGMGDGAIRCAYVGSNAMLSGFTLRNGYSRTNGDSRTECRGGGVWTETSGTITNCVVIDSSAYQGGGGAFGGLLQNCVVTRNSAGNGGGVFGAILQGCRLTNNFATWYGGGAYSSVLRNSVLTGNSCANAFGAAYGGGAAHGSSCNCLYTQNTADFGGGVHDVNLTNSTMSANAARRIGGGEYESTLYNCILYYNTAPSGPDAAYGSLNNSCSSPLVGGGGFGNITNQPCFLDTFAGNFRLRFGSPCINAGQNDSTPGTTDLDGRARIVGGVVDMGAYEFQGPGMGEFIGWLQQFGQTTDGSADYTDPDQDGLSNWQEWRCGTDPTNALSALRLLEVSSIASKMAVSWQSVPGVNYLLDRSTNLGSWPSFTPLASNIVGQAGTTTYIDTNPPAGPGFYRVGVSTR